MSKDTRRVDAIVGRCAEVAGKAPKITAYVMVYQTKNGTISYHRGGDASAQLGMVKLMETGIINGLMAVDE
jgi:hypothetical protein